MTQFDIRFIGLNRLFRKYRSEYLEATDRVLNSGIVVGGPCVAEFENKLSKIAMRKYAISVASCTDALFFILTSYGIGAGDEVITTSYSFIATASAILRTGATPIFVDVDEYYHLSLDHVHCAKTKKTKALVAVNLFGDCVDFCSFEKYCNKENLLLIEDAAQSFGSKYNGTPSGKLGHASAFSFSPMKPLPCFGTGGAIVTDDEEIAIKCKSLRRHGKINERNGSIFLGYNSIIPSDKAAQMNVTLKYIDLNQAKRMEVAGKYLSALKGSRDIITPKTRKKVDHCWHKFVIRSPQRDELQKHLSCKGIETQVHYKIPLPKEPIFGGDHADFFIQAITYSKTCLSLPIYAELEEEEVEYIIQQIRSFK